MKKIVMTMMMMGLLLVGFSQQRQQPMSEYVVSDVLYAYLSEPVVEQMRADNPAELIRMNYTVINNAVVVNKLWDGNFVEKGMLEDYLPEGMTYLEEDIIRNGCINTYQWKLPQDEYRYTVLKLRRSGYYVIVLPKTVLERRVQAQINLYSF